jgi:tol-pal system protein YbgF
MKTKFCLFVLFAALVALPATAQAGTKEELIRLQSEVMTLQKQFLEFSENYNERFGGLRSLMEQLNDQIAKSGNTLSRIGVALDSRTEDARNQDGSLRAEIRELSERIEEVYMGISALAQQFNDYKAQNTMRAGASSSVSAEAMFNQAMGDYMRGDLEIAIEGFNAYIENYPGGETAARALLAIGDSHTRLVQLKQAVDAFTRVINNYPQSSHVPPALYKRARIEDALQERDSAMADYRDIIERFPTAPEADLAKKELQALESAAKPKSSPKTTTTPRKPASR